MAKKKSKNIEKQSSDKNNERLCAILSYFLIGIIWYFADEKMKKSEFAKFHVKQGLILLIAWIVYDLIVGIVVWPLILLSFGLLAPILMLLYYVPLIWLILGVINAANNTEKELPIIGKFGKNFNF